MNALVEWLRRSRFVFQRNRLDQLMREEGEAHIEMRAAELEASGLSPGDATAQARREFGPMLRMTEDSQEPWRFRLLDDFSDDLRFAVRQLLANPGFLLTCVLSLALGIGATTAVFSVVRGVLLNPYPFHGVDRMVTFRVTSEVGYNGFSNYLLLNPIEFEMIGRSPVLDGVVATDSWDMAATGRDLPEAVHTGKLSANGLQYFGVPALVGRVFTEADAAERVVVLGHRYWQSHYGRDSKAIGQTLQLDRKDYQIIGVMPPSFEWFHDDVYIPLQLTNDPERVFIIDARLRPGISRQAAEDALQPLIAQFATASPKRFPPGARLKVLGINSRAEQRLAGTLTTLFGAVALLLVIGCANVSVLLLARSAGRGNELAVRSAIGASRARLVRQMLAEALLVGACGCVFGILIAYGAVPWLLRAVPRDSLPNEASVEVNGYVLLFAIGAGLLATLLFGMWPALTSSRVNLSQVIHAGSKRVLGSFKRRRSHEALVASQIALTLVLLAAAGASTAAFLRLYLSPLGFDPSHVLTLSLQFPDGTHTEIEERQAFYAQVRRKVEEIPGVKAVGLYPFGFPPRADFTRQLEIFDQPSLKAQTVYANPISREFFQAVGIPVIEGRVWSEHETHQAAKVAVVNRSFVQRYWPGHSGIGKRVRLPNYTAFTAWMLARPGSNDWLEVIGVAADTPNRGLSEPANPAIYVPYSLVLGDSFNLAIRTADEEPLKYSNAARRAVQSVSASQPVNEIRSAEQILADEGWAVERFVASLFLVFSVAALSLSTIGIYSAVAFLTRSRRHEFGVRVALGAQRSSIIKLVLLSGVWTTLTGIAGGFLLCGVLNAVLHRWIKSSLLDPALLFAVSAGLALVTLAASYLPALRSASADPMKTLRESDS